MTSFVGMNVFFGTALVSIGYWAQLVLENNSIGKLSFVFFCTMGVGIILSAVIKGRNLAFVEKFIVSLRALYRTPWDSLFCRLGRIFCTFSVLGVLTLDLGFVLPAAIFFNVCASYATAIAFWEFEKKNGS